MDEWDWQEHFSSQPENERYLNYVADKFHYNRCLGGRKEKVTARFLIYRIFASYCISMRFSYLSLAKEKIDFTGKNVAIIGMKLWKSGVGGN